MFGFASGRFVILGGVIRVGTGVIMWASLGLSLERWMVVIALPWERGGGIGLAGGSGCVFQWAKIALSKSGEVSACGLGSAVVAVER